MDINMKLKDRRTFLLGSAFFVLLFLSLSCVSAADNSTVGNLTTDDVNSTTVDNSTTTGVDITPVGNLTTPGVNIIPTVARGSDTGRLDSVKEGAKGGLVAGAIGGTAMGAATLGPLGAAVGAAGGALLGLAMGAAAGFFERHVNSTTVANSTTDDVNVEEVVGGSPKGTMVGSGTLGTIKVAGGIVVGGIIGILIGGLIGFCIGGPVGAIVGAGIRAAIFNQ